MILSKAEIALLSRGRRSEMDISAHKRKVLHRSPQNQKNKNIYNFYQRWTNQCKRHGWSKADKLHVRNLIRALERALNSS